MSSAIDILIGLQEEAEATRGAVQNLGLRKSQAKQDILLAKRDDETKEINSRTNNKKAKQRAREEGVKAQAQEAAQAPPVDILAPDQNALRGRGAGGIQLDAAGIKDAVSGGKNVQTKGGPQPGATGTVSSTQTQPGQPAGNFFGGGLAGGALNLLTRATGVNDALGTPQQQVTTTTRDTEGLRGLASTVVNKRELFEANPNRENANNFVRSNLDAVQGSGQFGKFVQAEIARIGSARKLARNEQRKAQALTFATGAEALKMNPKNFSTVYQGLLGGDMDKIDQGFSNEGLRRFEKEEKLSQLHITTAELQQKELSTRINVLTAGEQRAQALQGPNLQAAQADASRKQLDLKLLRDATVDNPWQGLGVPAMGMNRAALSDSAFMAYADRFYDENGALTNFGKSFEEMWAGEYAFRNGSLPIPFNLKEPKYYGVFKWGDTEGRRYTFIPQGIVFNTLAVNRVRPWEKGTDPTPEQMNMIGGLEDMGLPIRIVTLPPDQVEDGKDIAIEMPEELSGTADFGALLGAMDKKHPLHNLLTILWDGQKNVLGPAEQKTGQRWIPPANEAFTVPENVTPLTDEARAAKVETAKPLSRRAGEFVRSVIAPGPPGPNAPKPFEWWTAEPNPNLTFGAIGTKVRNSPLVTGPENFLQGLATPPQQRQ